MQQLTLYQTISALLNKYRGKCQNLHKTICSEWSHSSRAWFTPVLKKPYQ